ncbi:charged multivesicular body protein 7 isoform X2 [Heptranchias perlo]|uniref:charged multivesicular body protein 7 isoform X2 n=1 Tax=Heptranchias perlo TaxID=212740 RepID=UPI00355A08A0
MSFVPIGATMSAWPSYSRPSNRTARRGLIQKESNFAASVDAGWLAWGVGLLLIKPLKWTLSSVLGSNTVAPDEAFVIVERIKDKAADVFQLCQNCLQSSHPVAAFAKLQEVCQSVCKDEKTFCLCLLQLQKEKKVTVAEFDGDKIVKFTHSANKKVSAVSEIDVGVYQLVKCEKMLTKKVQTLSQEAESCKEDARSHLKTGRKHLALKSLRMRRRMDKRLENLHLKLDTIQTILDRIYSSQTDKTVVDAYQAGLGALKQSMKDVSVDKVENLMDQIEQFCDTQDDINQTLSGENLDSIGGVDTDELEAELNALLENTTEGGLLLPDVPTRSLKYDLGMAEVMDAELEAEHRKHTLSDAGLQTSAGIITLKSATSLEPAQ